MPIQLDTPQLGKIIYAGIIVMEIIILSVILAGNSSWAAISICLPGIIGFILNLVYLFATTLRYKRIIMRIIVNTLVGLIQLAYLVAFSMLLYTYFNFIQECFILNTSVNSIARALIINSLANFVLLW